jgi:N-acetyl-anhydromuramyl-L-alanine amidase AmpD
MAFTNSSLVSYTKISPNRTKNRNHAIDTITIHCYVGNVTVERAGAGFANPLRGASCNYVIGADGRIGLIVEEKDRSWCTSSPENDHRAVTIECASDTKHPYAVNAAVYNSLIKLVADICKRNGIKKLLWKADKKLIGQVNKQNMTVHRWFKNKDCPGEYLYSRHGEIAAKVNKLLGVIESNVAEKNSGIVYTVKKGDTLSKIAAAYNITVAMLAEYNGISNPNKISIGQAIKIPAASAPAPAYFKKYTGNSVSIVTALNAVGATSTYAYRSKIAKANNIKLYAGTAAHNKKMLTLLK